MRPQHFGQQRVDDDVHWDLGGIYLKAVVLADLRRGEEDEGILILWIVERLPGARPPHSEAPKIHKKCHFPRGKKSQHLRCLQHELLPCLPPTQRGTVIWYWDLEGLVEQSLDELLVRRRIVHRQRREPRARTRRVTDVPQRISVT